MIEIENISKLVEGKLSELRVLYVNNSSSIIISESDTNIKKDSVNLKSLNIEGLPTENLWVFDNEYCYDDIVDISRKKKGAFSSAGSKVEKTFIYQSGEILYILMVEMKTTITPMKIHEDVSKKFEDSLSTLSVYMSSNSYFSNIPNLRIYPVGVCCYNVYDDPKPDQNNGIDRTAGKVRLGYSSGKRFIPIKIEPLIFGRLMIPLVMLENPNPTIEGFSIGFLDLFGEMKL